MDCNCLSLAEGESAHIWRAEDIGDVELLHARYISHTFARHTHDGFAVGVIEEGVEAFDYHAAHHTAPGGSIVVFNPGEVHTGESATREGWRFRMFYFDPAILQRAASEFSGSQRDIPFFAQPVIRDESLFQSLRQLHCCLEAESLALERESRFLLTLAQLAVRHADDRPSADTVGHEPGAVRKARRYLEDRYMENVTLHELVQLTGLSAFHLLRVFRHATGMPPHLYLEQVRVHRARKLLRSGSSIADVSTLTGFADQSHFTRHFKRMTGVTPGQYRKIAISFKTTPSA